MGWLWVYGIGVAVSAVFWGWQIIEDDPWDYNAAGWQSVGAALAWPLVVLIVAGALLNAGMSFAWEKVRRK